MFKKKKTNIKDCRGFTLIEMLVVIAIITVLAGASLFAMQGSRESARDARRKADLETIRSGLELYRSDCNDYPLADEVVFTGPSDLNGDGTPTVCSSSNVYIDDIPQDSTSGRTYRYVRLTATTYELCAALETETTAVASCGNPGGCTLNCTYRVTNP